MKKSKSIIVLLILIIIALIAVCIFYSKKDKLVEIEYGYYSYYSDNFENNIIDGKEYKIIENYNDYNNLVKELNNIKFDEEIKGYEEDFFKERNLAVINVYVPSACSPSNYKININVKDDILKYEAEYSLGGVCAGGIGYLTIVELPKDINKIDVCLDNRFNGYDPEVEKKPVLYLYPEEDMNIEVSFKNPTNLLTTYPRYNDGWNVFVKKDGTILTNNREYYALYWENKTNTKVDFSTGFYVIKDEAIQFLEEKLTQIGLNYKEQNEFIMYWLPILEQNEKSLVYFELTEEKQKSNELIINPKPDSLLRVTIHIKKVNEYKKIEEQNLPKFERKGFTAVEWGGIEY